MLTDRIDARIQAMPESEARALLAGFLKWYVTPAFGALPKKEVEVEVYGLLRAAGIVAEDAPLYDLTSDLRLTRARARGLVYDYEVRRARAAADLDDDLRRLIVRASYFKDESYIVVEVEAPLIQAHLKEKLRRLGFLTDASFNPALVRLPLEGLAALIEDLLDDGAQRQVRAGLEEAKIVEPKLTFRRVITGALSSVVQKFAGEVAGEATKRMADVSADALGDFLGPILSGARDEVLDAFAQLTHRAD